MGANKDAPARRGSGVGSGNESEFSVCVVACEACQCNPENAATRQRLAVARCSSAVLSYGFFPVFYPVLRKILSPETPLENRGDSVLLPAHGTAQASNGRDGVSLAVVSVGISVAGTHRHTPVETPPPRLHLLLHGCAVDCYQWRDQ